MREEKREEHILYLQKQRISLEYAVSYGFSCNMLRQRSTIFNFYVLKMKREGKPALVKLQCFDVDLYG